MGLDVDYNNFLKYRMLTNRKFYVGGNLISIGIFFPRKPKSSTRDTVVKNLPLINRYKIL